MSNSLYLIWTNSFDNKIYRDQQMVGAYTAYSQFFELPLFTMDDARDIGRKVCVCLSVGSVPVIIASKDLIMKVETFLPFNQVLDWGRALIIRGRYRSEVNPGSEENSIQSVAIADRFFLSPS